MAQQQHHNDAQSLSSMMPAVDRCTVFNKSPLYDLEVIHRQNILCWSNDLERLVNMALNSASFLFGPFGYAEGNFETSGKTNLRGSIISGSIMFSRTAHKQ